MKKVILSLSFLAGICFFANAQTPSVTQVPPAASITPDPTNPNAADVQFEKEVIDYGTIEQNADGNREFKFKNTGKSDLLITNCQGSCGCTVPTWPKEPIKPGATAVIKVHYATERLGPFEKTVTVTSNAKSGSKVLKIKGDVKPSATPAATTPATPAPKTTDSKK